jgi:hypothetical protein
MKYIDACACEAWHLQVWPVLDPENTTAIPFRCRSWRHEGHCRRWKGAQDFARIKEGMGTLNHWCHLCLTYDPKRWKIPKQLYKLAIGHWSILRKRLTREFKELKYIQTWEQQASGYPHVHIAISSVEIYKKCNFDDIWNFQTLIKDHAVSSGFGKIGTLQVLNSKIAMAGYLVKLAKELVGGGPKDYQIPINAPAHFRRLRASVRLLPPPIKNPDITGTLRFCGLDGEIKRKIKETE